VIELKNSRIAFERKRMTDRNKGKRKGQDRREERVGKHFE
jgi:hypothetical protein